jgi:hypothetical protein
MATKGKSGIGHIGFGRQTPIPPPPVSRAITPPYHKPKVPPPAKNPLLRHIQPKKTLPIDPKSVVSVVTPVSVVAPKEPKEPKEPKKPTIKNNKNKLIKNNENKLALFIKQIEQNSGKKVKVI